MLSLAFKLLSGLFPRRDRMLSTGGKAERWPFPLPPARELQVFIISRNHNSSDIHETQYANYSTVCPTEIGQWGEWATRRWHACMYRFNYSFTQPFICCNNREPCNALWTLIKYFYIFFALNEYRWAAGNIIGTVTVFSVIILYLLSSPSPPLPPFTTARPLILSLLLLSSCAQRSSFVSTKTLIKSFIKGRKLLWSAGGRQATVCICVRWWISTVNTKCFY